MRANTANSTNVLIKVPTDVQPLAVIDCPVGEIKVLVVSITVQSHTHDVETVQLVKDIQRNDKLVFSPQHREPFRLVRQPPSGLPVDGR